MSSLDGVFNVLPDNLKLSIFRCLTMADLCTARRVCRTWRCVIADNTLWKHVDLLKYKLDLRLMWKIIRTHLSPTLLILKLKGSWNPSRMKRGTVSDKMLHELQTLCPAMEELCLIEVNLSGISASNLPNNIHRLSLLHSLVPQAWLAGLDQDHFLPRLTSINLAYSTKTSNRDITDLSRRAGMEEVCLDGCYRVTSQSLHPALKTWTKLTKLSLAGLRLDTLVFHTMCRHMPCLKDLCLDDVVGLTGEGLSCIGEMKSLVSLTMKRVKGITDEDVPHLYGLDILRHIFLPDGISREVSTTLKHRLPNECQILPHFDV